MIERWAQRAVQRQAGTVPRMTAWRLLWVVTAIAFGTLAGIELGHWLR